MSKPIVSKSLIVIDGQQPGLCAADVISLLCRRLEAEGYVGPGYEKAVLDREMRFPTALPTRPYATAIPHADPLDVRETGVAVAILDHAVAFRAMENPEESLPVRAVLLMAVTHSSQQVPALQWVCEVLNRQDVVMQLVSACTPSEAMAVLAPLLEGRGTPDHGRSVDKPQTCAGPHGQRSSEEAER